MSRLSTVIGLGLASGGLALYEGLPGFEPREHHSPALDVPVAACGEAVRKAVQACANDPLSVNKAASEGPDAELRHCLESQGVPTVYLVCHETDLGVSRALYIGGGR